MKNSIFYFSGTGNSLSLSKDLVGELSGFDAIPMASVWEAKTIQLAGDAVGLVFPLYYAGLPDLVCQFVRRASFPKGCYVFAVVAAAFPWSGRALHQLGRMLRRRGHALAGGFYVETVENYLPKYTIAPLEQQRATIEKSRETVRTIGEKITARVRHLDPDPAWYLYAIYPLFMAFLHQYDRLFRVGSRCNGCGICAKVCPVRNVDMAEGRPVWHHRCQFCMGCINWCPKAVIEWGNATSTHGRYRNPGVTVQEIALQSRARIP